MTAATQQGSPHETQIVADPALPTIRITREFDAPVEKVFGAHTDPDLVAQWLGPRAVTMRIDHFDCRTGGSWRYSEDSEQRENTFFGSFHEVRPDERIVQTFTWDGYPDGVSLETVTFEDLGGGRSRLVALSVVESLEIRDLIISSGMESGVVEGYEQLDEVLATSA
jgi:uncharacterized protein YndB with AHSA1/START domain